MPNAVSSSTLSLPSLSYKIKKAACIAVALLGVLLAAVLIVPHFVDLGVFKRTYLPRVEETLKRRLDVGQVRLSLVPKPSIRLSNLKVFDAPPYAEDTLLSSEQVRLQLNFWSLLKGRFEVSELVLDRPIFNLLRRPGETLNDSDIDRKKAAPGKRGRASKRAEAKESTSMPLLIPGNLTIRDGQFNVITGDKAAINIKGIDLSLRELSGAQPFPFRASFNYAGLKRIAWEGELDYREDKALLQLKNTNLTINELTLPVQGNVSHLSATPQFNLDLKTDNVDAKPVFQILSAFGLAPPDAEITGPMDVAVNLSGPSNSLVTHVRGALKDVKVQGKRALKGRLRGEVSLRLPMGAAPVSRRLQGSGKLAAHDGELTNVDLIKRIERVSGMIGFSRDERRQATTFQKMEADFNLGGGYAEFTRLYLVNPQMEVSGDGTMTLDRPTLDVAVSTALSPQASARAGRGRVTSYLKDKQGRIVVPLTIRGPVENPSVDLNAGEIAGRGLPENAEKGFSTLVNRLFRSR